jgi:hypothetical protein
MRLDLQIYVRKLRVQLTFCLSRTSRSLFISNYCTADHLLCLNLQIYVLLLQLTSCCAFHDLKLYLL